MISGTGIYVFESKNYSGWVFEDENQKNWAQTLENKRKTSLLIQYGKTMATLMS